MEASKHIRLEETYSLVTSIWAKVEGGKAVDVHSQVFSLMRNIITRLVFNKKYFASDSKEGLEFKETINDYFYLSGVFNLGDYIPYMQWLDIHGYERQMKAARKRMDAVMDAIIQEHRQKKIYHNGDSSLDFIDVLLSLGNKESDYERLSMENIKAMAINMLAAGTDTSAVTIEWALSEILLHSSVQKKAQEELDQVVGRERKVEEEDLPQLKYLQAIVKETFRLHPAGPFLIPHESTEAVEVSGYAIPAKVRLLVNASAIGRDPSRWERPLEFDPERFLHSSIDVRGQDFELIPFGSGRRACPGIVLGLVSVQLALAALLQSFEWSLPPSQKLDMTEKFGLTLPKALPLHAIALPRLPQHLYIKPTFQMSSAPLFSEINIRYGQLLPFIHKKEDVKYAIMSLTIFSKKDLKGISLYLSKVKGSGVSRERQKGIVFAREAAERERDTINDELSAFAISACSL